MAYETYFNMLLNIGLLVLIAALLTNLGLCGICFWRSRAVCFPSRLWQ